jgi:hypothetical protein
MNCLPKQVDKQIYREQGVMKYFAFAMNFAALLGFCLVALPLFSNHARAEPDFSDGCTPKWCYCCFVKDDNDTKDLSGAMN